MQSPADNEKEIKTLLLEGKPIVMAIKWYKDMKVVDGVLTTTKKDYVGGHCMLIYGWNEQGWKVLNSHGKSWGKKGKCIIPYDYELREAWGVIDTIKGTNIDIKKPFSSIIGKVVAKVLNTLWKVIDKSKK